MQVSSIAFVVLVAAALGVCRAADDPTVSLEGVHDLSEQPLYSQRANKLACCLPLS